MEAALSEHPGVADVVVVGLPDAEWGLRVHAIVEPLGSVEVIPRSAAGKVDRSALAAASSAPAPGPEAP